jgi:hypothetical protein
LDRRQPLHWLPSHALRLGCRNDGHHQTDVIRHEGRVS